MRPHIEPLVFTHKSGKVVEVSPQNSAVNIKRILESYHREIPGKDFSSLLLSKRDTYYGWRLKPGHRPEVLDTIANAAVLSYLIRYPYLTPEQVNSMPIRFKGCGLLEPLVIESLICLGNVASMVQPTDRGIIKNLIKQDFINNNRPIDHCWMVFLKYDLRTLLMLSQTAAALKPKLKTLSNNVQSNYNALFKNLYYNPNFYSAVNVTSAWDRALTMAFEDIKNTRNYVFNTILDKNLEWLLEPSPIDLVTEPYDSPDDYYVKNPVKQRIINYL